MEELEGVRYRFPYRYLGESREGLLYVRILAKADFFLWTLEDYYQRKWCLSYRVVIDIDVLPRCLLSCPVVAFDRRDPHVVYFNSGKRIFPYDLKNKELKPLHDTILDYPTTTKFHGLVCPYELPRCLQFLQSVTLMLSLVAQLSTIRLIWEPITLLGKVKLVFLPTLSPNNLYLGVQAICLFIHKDLEKRTVSTICSPEPASTDLGASSTILVGFLRVDSRICSRTDELSCSVQK
ncbi:hypothetical protein HHK36_025917 [Tetracentron sinense]|uniref:Uncharacterized protein n=1 Tax=Tetracentron sinense TaxID=13715 RepID=A0A835D6V4_TETSI|nr:hypothetical protein HHK36_025917 [Tetracentron sinense]